MLWGHRRQMGRQGILVHRERALCSRLLCCSFRNSNEAARVSPQLLRGGGIGDAGGLRRRRIDCRRGGRTNCGSTAGSCSRAGTSTSASACTSACTCAAPSCDVLGHAHLDAAIIEYRSKRVDRCGRLPNLLRHKCRESNRVDGCRRCDGHEQDHQRPQPWHLLLLAGCAQLCGCRKRFHRCRLEITPLSLVDFGDLKLCSAWLSSSSLVVASGSGMLGACWA